MIKTLILFIIFFFIAALNLWLYTNLNFLGIIVVSIVISSFFMLFSFAHRLKNTRRSYITLDSGNKNPQRPMQNYYDDLHEWLTQLGHKKEIINQELYHYHPMGRIKLEGQLVTVKYSSLMITVEGPNYLIRQLESLWDLKKIIL